MKGGEGACPLLIAHWVKPSNQCGLDPSDIEIAHCLDDGSSGQVRFTRLRLDPKRNIMVVANPKAEFATERHPVVHYLVNCKLTQNEQFANRSLRLLSLNLRIRAWGRLRELFTYLGDIIVIMSKASNQRALTYGSAPLHYEEVSAYQPLIIFKRIIKQVEFHDYASS